MSDMSDVPLSEAEQAELAQALTPGDNPICPGWKVTPTELAKYFHDEYERMAPHFGYKTREASAVPWEMVPEDNRHLMEAVCASVLQNWFPVHMTIPPDAAQMAKVTPPDITPPFEPVQ